MYHEVSSTLCNILPLSLVQQPSIVHKTYASIQQFLGNLTLNTAHTYG